MSTNHLDRAARANFSNQSWWRLVKNRGSSFEEMSFDNSQTELLAFGLGKLPTGLHVARQGVQQHVPPRTNPLQADYIRHPQTCIEAIQPPTAP